MSHLKTHWPIDNSCFSLLNWGKFWIFQSRDLLKRKRRSSSVSRILFHLKDCWSFISIASHLTTHAIYPWSRRTGSSTTYLMLLRVEIARFTRIKSTRLCCSNPHLTVDRCYLLRRPMESGLSSERILSAISWRTSSGKYSRFKRAMQWPSLANPFDFVVKKHRDKTAKDS